MGVEASALLFGISDADTNEYSEHRYPFRRCCCIHSSADRRSWPSSVLKRDTVTPTFLIIGFDELAHTMMKYLQLSYLDGSYIRLGYVPLPESQVLSLL